MCCRHLNRVSDERNALKEQLKESQKLLASLRAENKKLLSTAGESQASLLHKSHLHTHTHTLQQCVLAPAQPTLELNRNQHGVSLLVRHVSRPHTPTTHNTHTVTVLPTRVPGMLAIQCQPHSSHCPHLITAVPRDQRTPSSTWQRTHPPDTFSLDVGGHMTSTAIHISLNIGAVLLTQL